MTMAVPKKYYGIWVTWPDDIEGWAWLLPEDVPETSYMGFAVPFVQIPSAVPFVQIPSKLKPMLEGWRASPDVKSAEILEVYLPTRMKIIERLPY
jgi:hypothetical protein